MEIHEPWFQVVYLAKNGKQEFTGAGKESTQELEESKAWFSLDKPSPWASVSKAKEIVPPPPLGFPALPKHLRRSWSRWGVLRRGSVCAVLLRFVRQPGQPKEIRPQQLPMWEAHSLLRGEQNFKSGIIPASKSSSPCSKEVVSKLWGPIRYKCVCVCVLCIILN